MQLSSPAATKLHIWLCLPLVILLNACGGGGGSGGGPVRFEQPTIVLPDPEPDPAGIIPRNRYQLANQCFAIKAVANEQYLSFSSGSLQADASEVTDAEPFYFKPTALGSYLILNTESELLTANGSALQNNTLADADDTSVFTIFIDGDNTVYPDAPLFDTEPTPATVIAYREFVDPETESTVHNLVAASGERLALDGDNAAVLAASDSVDAQRFQFEPLLQGCFPFPEAQSNVNPNTPSFSGTTADGRVLGMADVHVHISATTFLGRSEWGSPFHKFGVTHALDQCDEYHGPNGTQDEIGPFFGEPSAGHATDGWPTFTFWPAHDSLTHEAIYWRWLERAWQAGLRIAVNELVDNQTLCELQRNASSDPTIDCDPMNNATNQIGSMYAMQDYIDAQFGGRGEGFFQIAWDSSEARTLIEEGKLAVVLGIEISNLFNCQITFNPGRTQDVDEETASPPGGNTYACTIEEDDGSGNLPENSILFQMQRLHNLGVRKIISIHEFDNAFGGNGIFLDFLNLGTRENSGGAPNTDANDPFAGNGGAETPTGEFWTTYNCPEEGEIPSFEDEPMDYLFEEEGGELLTSYANPGCLYTGFGGRPGGSTACYPRSTTQCNARWMTPTGLYTYKKMMELGFIFDYDHLELAMKTQVLDLTEAQPLPYPLVSTHGNFGGTSRAQAKRVLRNGGFIYPSNGSTSGFIDNMVELLGVYDDAMTEANVPIAERPLFGFGFGTDTNGLSEQTAPRGSAEVAARPASYPFTLFSGAEFSELNDFLSIAGVEFERPSVTPPGVDEPTRQWHVDEHGNAHYGMLADWVQEIQLEGDAEHIRHLYNSAEAFLQTWTRTEQAHAAIIAAGGAAGEAEDILDVAPTPASPVQEE